MGDIVLSIVFIVIGLLGMVVILAAPIIAVVAWENSRRRRFTRQLAEEFALKAELNENVRLTKASVWAKGAIDGMQVVVSANTPGTRIHGGPTTSMRVERGEIIVRAAKGPEARLFANTDTARDSNDFDAAFRWEGTPRALSESAKKLLLQHRQQFAKAFGVFFAPDGQMITPTDTLDTAKRHAIIRHRLQCLLEIGKSGLTR